MRSRRVVLSEAKDLHVMRIRRVVLGEAKDLHLSQ